MSAAKPAGLPQIAPYELPLAAEIPAPRGPWQLAPGRAALLIHDMQRYFLRPYAREASPIAPAIANIARLAATAFLAALRSSSVCSMLSSSTASRVAASMSY